LGWAAHFPQPFGLGCTALRPFRPYSELNEEWMKNADGDRCAFEYTFYTRMPTNCLHTPGAGASRPEIYLAKACFLAKI
ncbi:MAG TPA: hypothetical protein VM141_02325, partial [Planctomycetota bacterium]|nr:hypothetical protein [Planctomycetota bacterium]